MVSCLWSKFYEKDVAPSGIRDDSARQIAFIKCMVRKKHKIMITGAFLNLVHENVKVTFHFGNNGMQTTHVQKQTTHL